MEEKFELLSPSGVDLSLIENASRKVLSVHQASNGGKSFLIVRLEGKLVLNEYSQNSSKFLYRSTQNISTSDDINSYPLWTFGLQTPDNENVIIREKDGLKVYNINQNFEFLGKSDIFHDLYGTTQVVNVGRFFKNQKFVGLMRRDKNFASSFYVFKSQCFGGTSCDFLQRFSKKIELSDSWRNANTKFYLAKLDGSGQQETFALRTNDGLEFFQFNAKYDLEGVFVESNAGSLLGPQESGEKIIFGAFTNKNSADLMHLNSSGLFLYQRNPPADGFRMVNYDASFSRSSGWSNENSKSLFVTDLDGDMRNEMAFSGSDGLAVVSFDQTTQKWKNTLENSGSNQFSNIVSIGSLNEKSVVFLQSVDGSLMHHEVTKTISQAEKPSTTLPPSARRANASVSNQTISVYDIERVKKSSIAPSGDFRWTELWTNSFESNFLSKIPNDDGVVAFNMPLVDLSLSQYLKIQLAISYNDQSQAEDLTGVGWNIPLMNNYIRVDYRCSIFPDDFVFSFYGLVQRLVLKRDIELEISGSEVWRFTVPGHENMAVYYHTGKNSQWIIETETERFVYGADAKYGAVQLNLSWEHTRCDKTDTQSLIQVPVAWFLKERRDRVDEKSIYYRYNVVTETIDGHLYTHAITLRSISDDRKSLLTLSYREKSQEDKSKVGILENGKVVFPLALADDLYLSLLSVKTENFAQTFKFNYGFSEKQRVLVGVDQIFGNSFCEEIFKADYVTLKDRLLMKRCQLPRGSTVNFEHNQLNRKISQDGLVKKFGAAEKPQITSGVNYKVIAFKRGEKLNLRVHGGFEEDYVTEISAGSTSFEYRVVAANDVLFVVLLTTDSEKLLATFCKREKTWAREGVGRNFSKEDEVYFGENFIAFVKKESYAIKILQWKDEDAGLVEKILQSPGNAKFLKVVFNGKLFVAYDDSNLIVFHKNVKNEWETKIVREMRNFDATTKNTIKMFNIDDEITEQLLASVEGNFLQVNGNQILLSKLVAATGVLSVHLHMLLLTANYEVVEQVEVITRENLSNIRHEETQGGTKFLMKYAKVGAKFLVHISDILSGKLFDELNKVDARYRSSEKSRVIEEFNEEANWKAYLKKMFLLDWKKYHAKLTPLGVICGDDFRYEMTGAKWVQKWVKLEKKSTFRLGKYEIEQEDPKVDELNFYEISDPNQRKLVQKMKIEGKFVNAFPVYVAYQTSNNSVNLINFQSDGSLGKVRSIANSKLLSGDFDGMTTVEKAKTWSHAEPNEVCIYPISALASKVSEFYISRKTLQAGTLKRIIAYERSFDVDANGNVSETFVMRPGDSKNTFGWYEETKSVNSSNKIITKEGKSFFANGELKGHRFEEIDAKAVGDGADDSEDDDELSSRLMDKSGRLEIVDLRPQKLIDENFAFFGFEAYELDSIGTKDSDNHWNYPKANVIRKEFSLTGESFLRLTGDAGSLEGRIKPKKQNELFVASCWVRSGVKMIMNSLKETFVAVINSRQRGNVAFLKSRVKRQMGEWSYLEILIDFRKHSRRNDELGIVLRVQAKNNASIDVDHVRFSLINHDFIIEVFNANEKVTERILPNGSIKRKLFNKYEREVAAMDENGNVEEIKSSSMSGHLPNVSSLPRVCNLSFKATKNEFHNSVEWWKTWKISEIEESGNWSFAPGQMRHIGSDSHQIFIPSNLLNLSSSVVRFDYALNSDGAVIKLQVKSSTILALSKELRIGKLSIREASFDVPLAGELIFLIEKSRFVVWVDGIKIADNGEMQRFDDGDSLAITQSGSIAMENFVTLDNPMVTVEYLNSWNEPTQIINLESEGIAQVTEILHDSLGRRSITTKATRMTRNANQQLLSFYEDFVKNGDYDSPKSVWLTHRLEGDVDTLNPQCEGFPYKRTEFEKNPSRDKAAVGLPGKEFSIQGPYSKKIQSKSDIPFLLNLFPVSKGFTVHTKVNENGSKKITVFDENDRKVAVYVRVPGSDHILSINEYNSDDRIVKILPPIYHEKANTFDRETPWQFGSDHLTEETAKLQKLYGTHFEYDDDGNVLLKSTPDGGIVEYVYDKAGNRRFMKLGDGTVVYFVYDDAEQLIETGELEDSLEMERLRQLAGTDKLAGTIRRKKSQEFSYSNEYENPLERKAIKKFITHNDGSNVYDEISFDLKDHVTSKSSALPSEPTMNVTRTFEMNRMTSITYPKESASEDELMLVYNYDKRGNLIAIGTVDDATQFAEFTYNADGQLRSETVQPGSESKFVREYEYQAAGYLEKISDPFLTEEMTYTSNGYGQKGFGDGVISSTTFKASWASSADSRLFQVTADDLMADKQLLTKCFKVLQQNGYLTTTGAIQKSLNVGTEEKLPLECRGRVGNQIAQIIARKQIPKHYGHRFAYGNHQELIKAKYFSNADSFQMQPLKSDSFTKVLRSAEDSLEIWSLLVEAGFISTDQRSDNFKDATGKRGTEPLLRIKEIEDELKSLWSPTFDALKVAPEVEKLILKWILSKQSATRLQFEENFLSIYGLTTDSIDWQVVQLKQTAKSVFEKLSAKKLLPASPNLFSPLNPKLLKALAKHLNKIPEIITVLHFHWSADLGESPFDVSSYKIDSNGNHRLFYNGFQRFELVYKKETNKVKSIKTDNIASSGAVRSYAVRHDNNGNVIQALYKNIENIVYFATSQRPKEILMTDGRLLKFFYDAIGERILKQVFDAKGGLQSSVKYVRDEKGNVLVDVKTIYHPKPQPAEKIVTKYIYGPGGMIGFIRKGEYFSVAKDHAGSTRLIIKNRKVVASYDYMPYGELMRKFVTNAAFEVAYRYTGQEFDEETGLYNYHARLYDPSIGRFYQIDPQAQSFSPYMYSGNSPITFVDPDGEFFFIAAIIVGAAVGAYIGGAQNSNSWNPIKWDWKSPNTYIGMGTGALAGGLLPIAAVPLSTAALVTAGGLGLGAGYITASAANKNLDPTKWNWKSPVTYGAMFDGFTTGFSIVHGFTSINTLSKTLSIEILQKAYLPASIVGATGFAYYKGVGANEGNFAFWQWNWSSEGMAVTFGEMVHGFSTVVAASATVAGMNKIQIKQLLDEPSKALETISDISRGNKVKELLSKLPKPLAENFSGVIVGIYRAVGEENLENFDITNIKFFELSTYEAFMNGFFEGKMLATNPAQINKALIRSKNHLKAKELTKKSGSSKLQNQNAVKKPDTAAPVRFPGSRDKPDLNIDREKRSFRSSLRVSFEPGNNFAKVPISKNSDKKENNKRRRRTGTRDKVRNPINNGYIIPRNFVERETFANQIPNKTSSFDMLDFGDQWLQRVNIAGNLTLLNLLVEKFSVTRNTARKSAERSQKSNVARQVRISEVVHDFVEYFLVTAEHFGIPEETLSRMSEDSIDLTALKREVSRAVAKWDFERVSKVLIGGLFETNLATLEIYLEDDKIAELYENLLKHAKIAVRDLENFETAEN